MVMASSRKRKLLKSTNQSSLNDLAEELLFEILVRLPIMPVHRCKCVSKHWCALISNPYFSQQYVFIRPQYSPSQFTLLCWLNFRGKKIYRTSKEEVFKKHAGFSFRFIPAKSRPDVLASCNGLVLCADKMSCTCPYYICNPLTMQWVQLPSPPRYTRFFGFVCHTNLHQFSTAPQYKVVGIRYVHGFSKQFEARIFSFDTGKWSEVIVQCPMRYFGMPGHNKGAIAGCNGVIYWLFNRDGIIAYDVHKSVAQCSIIDMHKDMRIRKSDNLLIGICQGRLRLCQTKVYNVLNVWELTNSEASEWKLEHSICLNALLGAVGDIDDKDELLFGIYEIDGDAVYIRARQCIYACNLKNIASESIFPKTKFRISTGASLFLLPWWPTPLPRKNMS